MTHLPQPQDIGSARVAGLDSGAQKLDGFGNRGGRNDRGPRDAAAHRRCAFHQSGIAIPHQRAGTAADDVHRTKPGGVNFRGSERFHQGLCCAPDTRRHVAHQPQCNPVSQFDYVRLQTIVESYQPAHGDPLRKFMATGGTSFRACGKPRQHCCPGWPLIAGAAIASALLDILARGFEPHEFGFCTAVAS